MNDDRDSYYERVTHYSAERVAPFNIANKRSPQARDTERRLLIKRIDLKDGMTVVDTGAGGGYLVDGFPPSVAASGMIVCTDTAEYFMRSIPPPFKALVCGMDAFPIKDGSVDRVCNLAGLHHVQHKNRFFAEALRMLKPGGRAAVADVLAHTAPARWLNGPVDRYTDIGHDGMFVEKGELTELLSGAGFVDAEERHEKFTWPFGSWDELVQFACDLFRLNHHDRTEIERDIRDHLKVATTDDGVSLEWELTYATGRRA